MKGSKSVKNILSDFYKSDSRITVISFDSKTGMRKLTYSGLNIFSAMDEIARKTAAGFIVRVFIGLPRANFGLERKLQDYDRSRYDPYRYEVAQ